MFTNAETKKVMIVVKYALSALIRLPKSGYGLEKSTKRKSTNVSTKNSKDKMISRKPDHKSVWKEDLLKTNKSEKFSLKILVRQLI